MNESMINFVSKLLPTKKLRRNFKESLKQNLAEKQQLAYKKKKLIMTLVCKDEIEIIEKHLLFHHHMGIDGYIVTDNNSTDGTREILEEYKKKGIVLEIIDEPCPTHMHGVWVHRMVDIAIKKYHADWIINSDADEFWYAQSEDLKYDIAQCGKANVLNLYFRNFVPPVSPDEDYFQTCSFVTRLLPKYEAEALGVSNPHYIDNHPMPKVIHQTKGYIHILDGNHGVKIKNPDIVSPSNIRLYHYYIRNYKHFEHKVVKGYASVKDHPQKGIGSEWRLWYEKYYSQGKLADAYSEKFAFDKLPVLREVGCVVNDPSIINFMKHKNIL